MYISIHFGFIIHRRIIMFGSKRYGAEL
jgi:hypothetical protein